MYSSSIETLEDRKLLSTVVGVSGRDLLVFFDSADPGETLAKIKVKGLQRQESLLGIDFRPANGLLYAIGDSSRLYQIDVTTGTATAIGTAPFSPALAGEAFGFDFNPSVDAVRAVSDAEQNVRLNVTTGAVVGTGDLALAYVSGDPRFGTTPGVAAIAYTNSVAAGTPTTLFGIDSDTDSLVRIGGVDGALPLPNDGALTTVGALNVNVQSVNGFDILSGGGANTAFAILTTGATARSSLYTINLVTGAATEVGAVRASAKPLNAMAVAPGGNTIIALDKANRLSSSSSVTPNITTNRLKVTGLQRGEKLVSIDRRPSDGLIYGFSNQSRLYTVNTSTAVATVVGTQAQFTAAKKALVSIDFNPFVDKLRVVDSATENLRIEPATGQVIDGAPASTATVELDGPLVYDTADANAAADPFVVAAAYTNAIVGPASTVLYAIDTRLDVLTTIGTADGAISPNLGRMFTVGALGVNVKSEAGFDIITTTSEVAYAAFREQRGGSSLYTINLTTGAAAKVGALGKGVTPVAITVIPAVV